MEEPRRWAPDRLRLLLDVEALVTGMERRPASGRALVTIYGEAPPLGEASASPPTCASIGPWATAIRPASTIPPSSGARASRGWAADARIGCARSPPDLPPGAARVKRWAVARLGAVLARGLGRAARRPAPRRARPRCRARWTIAFRRAGVYHVLAVSGFNVALVSASIFAALSMVGVSRGVTAAVAAAALVGFALVVGAQAVRAARDPDGAPAPGRHRARARVPAAERPRARRAHPPRLAAGRSRGPGLPALLRGHRRHRVPRGPAQARRSRGSAARRESPPQWR